MALFNALGSGRGGSGMSPIAMGLLGLLAYRTLKGKGRLADMLGTAATPGSAGSPLSGGALGNGLKDLLDRFRQGGHEDKAQSWGIHWSKQIHCSAGAGAGARRRAHPVVDRADGNAAGTAARRPQWRVARRRRQAHAEWPHPDGRGTVAQRVKLVHRSGLNRAAQHSHQRRAGETAASASL